MSENFNRREMMAATAASQVSLPLKGELPLNDVFLTFPTITKPEEAAVLAGYGIANIQSVAGQTWTAIRKACLSHEQDRLAGFLRGLLDCGVDIENIEQYMVALEALSPEDESELREYGMKAQEKSPLHLPITQSQQWGCFVADVLVNNAMEYSSLVEILYRAGINADSFLRNIANVHFAHPREKFSARMLLERGRAEMMVVDSLKRVLLGKEQPGLARIQLDEKDVADHAQLLMRKTSRIFVRLEQQSLAVFREEIGRLARNQKIARELQKEGRRPKPRISSVAREAIGNLLAQILSPGQELAAQLESLQKPEPEQD